MKRHFLIFLSYPFFMFFSKIFVLASRKLGLIQHRFVCLCCAGTWLAAET